MQALWTIPVCQCEYIASFSMHIGKVLKDTSVYLETFLCVCVITSMEKYLQKQEILTVIHVLRKY